VSGGPVTTLTEETFDDAVASSSSPLLVDFWAEWCTPCLALAPIVDEVAAEEEGRIEVARLNIIDAPGVAERWGVQTVPTMILFHHGEVAKRIHGARGKRQLLEELRTFLE
jgi:thioredoxin 1